MFNLMNAAKVIKEIDALPVEEQSKVMAHLHEMQEAQYHEAQVRIAEQRLDDLENGIEEEIPYDQVKELMRSRA